MPTQEVTCSPRYLPRLFSLTELKKHKRSRHRRAAPPITINLVELNSYRNGHQLDFDVLCSQRVLPFALSIKTILSFYQSYLSKRLRYSSFSYRAIEMAPGYHCGHAMIGLASLVDLLLCPYFGSCVACALESLFDRSRAATYLLLSSLLYTKPRLVHDKQPG